MSKKEKALLFEGHEYAIHVTGRNVHVSEAMKQYAIDKVAKVERFTDKIVDVQIVMDIQKHDHRVDITLVAHDIKIKAHAVSSDMYLSVDQAVERICSQIKRYLGRIRDHHTRPREEREVLVDVIRPLTEEEEVEAFNSELTAIENEDLLKTYSPHKLIRQEVLKVKTLSLEEATMKMDLSMDSFLVFKGIHNNRIHIIYRGDDGDYGIILLDS